MSDHPPDETTPSQQRLDALLAHYAREPLPSVPGDLESRVWREIRARRSQPASIGAWLNALLARPSRWSPALAAVAVALCVGMVMGRADTGIAPGSVPPSRTQTGESLGLAVFSAEPPALPSTLLARLP